METWHTIFGPHIGSFCLRSYLAICWHAGARRNTFQPVDELSINSNCKNLSTLIPNDAYFPAEISTCNSATVSRVRDSFVRDFFRLFFRFFACDRSRRIAHERRARDFYGGCSCEKACVSNRRYIIFVFVVCFLA